MLRPFSSLPAATTTAAMAPSSRRAQAPAPHPASSVSLSSVSTCKHSPSSATLDLLILLLVLFSLAFLLASSLAHVFRSLSPFLSSPLAAAVLASAAAAVPYLAATLALAAAAFFSCRRWPRRRCRNPRCRGLKKALEFDVQLQTEEAVRSGGGSSVGGADAAMWREIEALPWKGGQGGNNPDYECLRAELRRMAPPNGRAVLLFRNRCGCPIAKLEGWGPKRNRRNKKTWHNRFGAGDAPRQEKCLLALEDMNLN